MNRHAPFEETYTPNAIGGTTPRFVGPTISRQRVTIMAGFGALVMLLLLGRTIQISVLQREHWQRIADRNSSRTVVLPAARGEIRDRHGKLLATNTPSFAAILFPDRLPTDVSERSTLLATLATRFALSPEELERDIHAAETTEYIVAKEGMTADDALPLMAGLRSNAIEVVFRPERTYLSGTTRNETQPIMFGNLLGFAGRVGPEEYAKLAGRGYRRDDLTGKQGIERHNEDELRGTHGELRYDVAADGQLLNNPQRAPSEAGDNLELTIDSDLQRTVATAFQRVAPGKNGAVTVLDASTGDVLALATFPDFNPNAFTASGPSNERSRILNDARRPLFFRPIVGQYPPGSTIKPFLSLGLLRDGIITEKTSVISRGGIAIREWFFPDWKAGGHGRTNVVKALAESVNTFFYLAVGGYPLRDGRYPPRDAIAPEQVRAMLERVGFTRKTGIDLPDEAAGFFPTPEWKQQTKGEPWYIGDAYHLAIGQGDVLVTPLQLAVATAALANGGTLVEPHVVRRVVGSKGNVVSDNTPVVRRTFDAREIEVLSMVQRGLRQAVTAGSARRLADLPIPVAGKTGTAQWHTTRAPHSWFIGYAPSNNPKIALSVLIEEGGEGSGAALSIAREIFLWYAAHQNELSS